MQQADIVTITAMGALAEGAADIDGEKTFVPFTLPGEQVEVVRSGQRAHASKIIKPSPDRVSPPCPHFGQCGGCLLQHWSAEPYRAWKRGLIASQLAYAGIETNIEPLVDAHGAGRRRATLHATAQGAGYAGWRSHDFHHLDTCPILVPELANAPAIATACAQLAGPCDVAFTASATGLDVSVRTTAKPGAKRPEFAPLVQKFNLSRLALNGEVMVLQRNPTIHMGRAEIALPLDSFLQATQAGEAILAELVVAAIGKARRVADLFCGLGPFALRIAETAQVFAVDVDRKAVAACDAALQATPGLKRIGCEARDLFRDPLTASELNRFDAVVFDPPRAGAQSQVQELARSTVKTVVAVSCDPATFARDAKILVNSGYVLDRVIPVDQFKYSAHIELVARFRRT